MLSKSQFWLLAPPFLKLIYGRLTIFELIEDLKGSIFWGSPPLSTFV
jgi:hypothetical protein